MPLTYVLVPGAGGDPFIWHRLVALLRDAGHEALTPELPVADDRAGLEAYADAIIVAAAGRERIVIVAQSMGALAGPVAAERLGAEQLVLVAPMIPAPGETGGEWWTATGQSSGSCTTCRSR